MSNNNEKTASVNVNGRDAQGSKKHQGIDPRGVFEQMLKGIADVEFGAFYVDTILESRLTGRGATIYHPARNPIRANTLAARAGLTALDIIVSVNGIILNDEMTFEYAWRKYQHDDSVRLLIRRGGREATIDIGPGT